MKGLSVSPSDSKLTFKELLEKNKTVSIHQKNLQVLATEIFKTKLNISPEILKERFSFNVRNYNLRSQSTLKRIKQILCTLAAKASPHWHRKYATWFQTVSKTKIHQKGLKVG